MEKFIKTIDNIIKEDLEAGEKLDKLIDTLESFRPIISKSLYDDLKGLIYMDAEKYSDDVVIIIISSYLNSLKI